MPRKIGGWRSTGSRPMSQLVSTGSTGSLLLAKCAMSDMCWWNPWSFGILRSRWAMLAMNAAPKSWLYKISPAGLQKKGTETYGGLKTVRWPRVFPLKSAQSDDEKKPKSESFPPTHLFGIFEVPTLLAIPQLPLQPLSQVPPPQPTLKSCWRLKEEEGKPPHGLRINRCKNQPGNPTKNQPLVAKKIGNLANWPSMTNTKQVKPRFLVLQWFHYHCLHAIPGALGSTVRHLILQVVHPLRGPEVDWRWLKMIEASRLHLSMIQWISSPCLKILHWQIGPEKIHQNPLVKGPGSSQLRQPPAKTRSQEPACWASKGSWIPIIITIYLDILSLSNPPTKYSLVYLVEHWLRYECVVYIYI